MSGQQGESLGNVHGSVNTENKLGWRKIMAFLGPAYLVSVGYMDPGNWATDIAGGSEFGYRLIWILFVSNLLALLLQSLSARLGIVRGLDLAQVSKNTYTRFVNICLYILAQIAIVACDLAEVIGMAIGLQLLFHLPMLWGISLTVSDTLLLLFLMNKGMRKLEGFIISMIFIIGLAFLIEMFIVKPDVVDIAKGFLPHNLSGSELYIAIGIIGATVMPHNLYLHSSLVQTRKIERTDAGIKQALKFNLFDTSIALNLAFLVNAAILILAASAFFRNGYFQVAEIKDAYKLLNHIFGSLAPMLFAIALIASGQSSTITGTLAGQIIMEGHINLRIQPWLRRLLTRLLAIIPAVLTIVYFGEESLTSLIILSQVVLSLQLGFAVIPLIHFTSDEEYMGKFAIGWKIKVLAWLSAALIVVLNAKLIVEQIGDWIKDYPSITPWMYGLIIPLTIGIAFLLVYVFLKPIYFKHHTAPGTTVPHGEATTIGSLAPILYKRIAVTIDFSGKDRDSIRNALMQGGKDAEYTLIHIVETAAAGYLGTEALDHETQSDRENLDKYIAELRAMHYHAHGIIGYGKASNAIAKIVNDEGIDFIVMGGHGHKALKDIIFGTTVDAVRHRVNVPILIVKPDKQ